MDKKVLYVQSAQFKEMGYLAMYADDNASVEEVFEAARKYNDQGFQLKVIYRKRWFLIYNQTPYSEFKQAASRNSNDKMMNEYGFELLSCENGIIKFRTPDKMSLKNAFEIAKSLLTEDVIVQIIYNGLPLTINDDSTYEEIENIYKLFDESENE